MPSSVLVRTSTLQHPQGPFHQRSSSTWIVSVQRAGTPSCAACNVRTRTGTPRARGPQFGMFVRDISRSSLGVSGARSESGTNALPRTPWRSQLQHDQHPRFVTRQHNTAPVQPRMETTRRTARASGIGTWFTTSASQWYSACPTMLRHGGKKPFRQICSNLLWEWHCSGAADRRPSGCGQQHSQEVATEKRSRRGRSSAISDRNRW